MFIPSIGICSVNSRATLSKVPSPPKLITKSQLELEMFAKDPIVLTPERQTGSTTLTSKSSVNSYITWFTVGSLSNPSLT